ncbi:Oidioi.mRNA.OKI2018_I69.chr1.g3871.t2.cds [Oikopleura dioica]|uniref:Oidioi.mRNA.OKI2018_I69.chr1.g3871.t2.cds n=1 Tax=Oikopleura dioica TaxID=34765 RepID=A0ABN7T105_OIKDI|nr:Oidioi.mRNA.OKI2018_I69.chr1.g3871.t2.cds [Oikopleura dioica]
MSSIGSRLAGASPNFGAGYPQNSGFQNQHTSSPYHGQQTQQAPFSSPHHQSVPQVVHNGAGYNTPNNTGIIPPSQITPNRASPASYASTPSHSYNPPTQSSVNSPYGYGNGSTSTYNSPHQSPYAQQQQQHHQAPRPGYGSPGYGQGYSAVPNQYGSQSVSGGGYGRSPLTQGLVGQITNAVAGKVSTEYAEKAIQKSIDLKDWGLKTYRCTKQMYNERTGKGTRTVDFQLDEKIQKIKNTKARYTRLLELTSSLAAQLTAIKGTHKAMSEVFNDLTRQQPELMGELSVNGSVYHHITDQGDTLIKVLSSFADSLKTLVTQTIQDSLDTITNYEKCRIEYDAYRNQLEELQMTQRNAMSGKVRETQFKMDQARAAYEQKRSDVGVKLELLDENRIKVMRQQCLLLHSATVAYFNGSYEKVAETVKVLERYQQERQEEIPSFLETENYVNGSGTPPCGRTPVDDAPPQMFDMLGEPIVPQEQRVATPPIHGVNIVGTMNSAPVADLISTQNSKPATPEPTNGVHIVGVISHDEKENQEQPPAQEAQLISTEETAEKDDLSLQFKEASI